MVIWLVGLSGVGKTTIGEAIYREMKSKNTGTVFVDGDRVRSLFQHDQDMVDYSLAGRRISAERLQSMCVWLDSEGLDVVCCAISMFQDINNANRGLFSDYREIYIDVPLETLVARDNKGLYQAALAGKIVNVVGVDIPYHAPTNVDLVIQNSFQADALHGYVEDILRVCGATH